MPSPTHGMAEHTAQCVSVFLYCPSERSERGERVFHTVVWRCCPRPPPRPKVLILVGWLRFMGKFQPISISKSTALATLASETGLVTSLTTDAASEGYWTVSTDLNISWDNPTAGEGSIAVYLAHNDWSLAEIEEYIELATGFDRGDKKAQEIQSRGRSIRKVGSLTAEQNNLNDGKPTRTKFRQYIDEGNTLQLCFYNEGPSALTTGSEISVSGVMFGNWAN